MFKRLIAVVTILVALGLITVTDSSAQSSGDCANSISQGPRLTVHTRFMFVSPVFTSRAFGRFLIPPCYLMMLKMGQPKTMQARARPAVSSDGSAMEACHRRLRASAIAAPGLRMLPAIMGARSPCNLRIIGSNPPQLSLRG